MSGRGCGSIVLHSLTHSLIDLLPVVAITVNCIFVFTPSLSLLLSLSSLSLSLSISVCLLYLCIYLLLLIINIVFIVLFIMSNCIITSVYCVCMPPPSLSLSSSLPPSLPPSLSSSLSSFKYAFVHIPICKLVNYYYAMAFLDDLSNPFSCFRNHLIIVYWYCHMQLYVT